MFSSFVSGTHHRVLINICFSRVVVDSMIIILDKLQPSPFPKIQGWLRENIFQTLIVCIKFTSLFHKVISLNIESVNYNG
jgi:hypothetical protein